MMRLLAISALLSCVTATVAMACRATDFLAIPLASGGSAPATKALRLAYPDLRISDDGAAWALDGAPQWRPLGDAAARDPETLLRDASVIDQFRYAYPLDYLAHADRPAWEDPGRPRNAALFAALWFSDEAAARASLVTVEQPDLAAVRYLVTEKRGVACQLQAALDLVAATDPGAAHVFRTPGGGFNWRSIAGASRLSAHSFGIAVDVNAELGGYWRWSRARAGAAPAYESRVPESVVRAMERFGFIWGGKWHHFDGMHFEYRPELILHARLLAEN